MQADNAHQALLEAMQNKFIGEYLLNYYLCKLHVNACLYLPSDTIAWYLGAIPINIVMTIFSQFCYNFKKLNIIKKKLP